MDESKQRKPSQHKKFSDEAKDKRKGASKSLEGVYKKKPDVEPTYEEWAKRKATHKESPNGNFPHHRAKTRKGKNKESEYRWKTVDNAKKKGYSKEGIKDIEDHMQYQDRESYGSRFNYTPTSKKEAKAKEARKKDDLAKKAKKSVLMKKKRGK